jgi:photosystem II stability/assembly factor-like uncharacterized protein
MKQILRLFAAGSLAIMFAVIPLPAQDFRSDLPGKYLETPLQAGTSLWSVDVLHHDTALAVGDHGLIKKTADAGSSWTIQGGSDISETFLGIDFIDREHAFAVGYSGRVLRTVDGGGTWIPTPAVTLQTLFAVSFVDTNTGTVVGEHGVIFRTSDGGQTWTRQDSGRAAFLLSVSFADAQTGTTVGSNGVILHTTNGGDTWTSQSSGVPNYLYGVTFTDPATGTAVGTARSGSEATILRTTNGGNNWIAQRSGTTNFLYSVSFLHTDTGAAVGSSGTLLRTTNGGATWVNRRTSTTNNLYSVSLTADTNNGIAVGANATIVRIKDTTLIVTAVEERDPESPADFTLSQNFPNPFNPTTEFEFQIPVSSGGSSPETFVLLKVYDVLGREVATIVDERLPAGVYRRSWNAEHSASGIYFARLTAMNSADPGKSFNRVRKMLLIR